MTSDFACHRSASFQSTLYKSKRHQLILQTQHYVQSVSSVSDMQVTLGMCLTSGDAFVCFVPRAFVCLPL